MDDYITPDPMKRQLRPTQVSFTLMHWYEYEHDLNNMDEHQFKWIKSFFYHLSYLTYEERAFLAYLYYYKECNDRKTLKQAAEHFHLKDAHAASLHKLSITKEM